MPFVLLGAAIGGYTVLAAILILTLGRMLLDSLVATTGAEAAPGAPFPEGARLAELLALLHFPMLAVAVAAVSGATGLGFWDGFGMLALCGGYFALTGAATAEVLLSDAEPRRRLLGTAVLASLLAGHRAVAIPAIHHRHVATADDPFSAAPGEGLYRFALRSWSEGFIAGWEIVPALAALEGRRVEVWRHPYLTGALGGLAALALAALAFGGSGLIALLLIALWAQAGMTVQDYLQHYGLRRRRIDDETTEPVAPWHAWNSAAWFGSGLVLNATRHSALHAEPALPYWNRWLATNTQAPRLPHAPAAMAALALVPPLWRGVMDRRVAAWQARIGSGEIATAVPPPQVARPAPPTHRPDADLPPRAADPVRATTADGIAPFPDGSEEDLLDRLMRTDPGDLPEPAQAPAPARPRSLPATRSPELWASEETESGTGATPDATPDEAEDAPDEAPLPRFMRSAELFETDGAVPPAALKSAGRPTAATAPARRGGARESGGDVPVTVSLESSVAEIVADARKDARRRRAVFAALEPAEDGAAEPTTAETAQAVGWSAWIAFRALGALLQGAPVTPRDEP